MHNVIILVLIMKHTQSMRTVDASKKSLKKEHCQEWDSNPRLHLETRAPAPIAERYSNLKPGALVDRSAILTYLYYVIPLTSL